MSAASSPARQNRPEGFTLVQAAECGDVGTVEVLLATGADVNAATQHGMTALMSAAAKGHLRLVSLLLERGADINTKRYDGLDALALSVFFGHLHVVRELLGRGADPNAKVRFGTSPEMWATTRGFHDIAQILTEAKAASSRETPAHRSDEINGPSPELTGAQEPILREAFFSDEGPSAETRSHATEASPIPAQVLPASASQDAAGRFGELDHEWSMGWTNSSELTLESPASIWNIADDPHKENEVQPRNSGTIAEPMTDEVTLNGADMFAPVITQQPRALPVEKQPSPIYSTYVAKPRYHHKRKFPKLVRCLAYITSGWQRLTVTTLIVMLLCGLGTLAFLKVLSPSKATRPANVAESSAPALPQFDAQNNPHSTTRPEVISSESAKNDASGKQSVDSEKKSKDGIGPDVVRIEYPRNSRVAEKSLRKLTEKVIGTRPKQAITPKREAQAVLHPAPPFRSASDTAKRMPSRSAADAAHIALEDRGAKAPPPAPAPPLSLEVQRPRSVAARNDSPAPTATPSRNTKTKVIQWP